MSAYGETGVPSLTIKDGIVYFFQKAYLRAGGIELD